MAIGNNYTKYFGLLKLDIKYYMIDIIIKINELYSIIQVK